MLDFNSEKFSPMFTYVYISDFVFLYFERCKLKSPIPLIDDYSHTTFEDVFIEFKLCTDCKMNVLSVRLSQISLRVLKKWILFPFPRPNCDVIPIAQIPCFLVHIPCDPYIATDNLIFLVQKRQISVPICSD